MFLSIFSRINIIKKFYLYGFLKGLQFFEPFFILFLLEKKLNFFEIGLLISIREITINLSEIPTGMIADDFGKKVSMLLCFFFYILSFNLFYFSFNIYILIFAIILFGFGESFRTGTHKAIVMDVLENENLKQDSTKIFGNIRFFGKTGGAVSGIIASIFVFLFSSYSIVFLFNIIPYLFAFLLIYSYPDYLNKNQFSSKKFNLLIYFKKFFKDIFYILKDSTTNKLLLNSCSYEGIIKICYDYMQPFILWSIGIYSVYFSIQIKPYSSFIIGFIYFFIKVISALASAFAYIFEKKNKNQFSLLVYFNYITGCFLLLIFIFYKLEFALIGLLIFISLYFLQNARRPLMISIFYSIIEKKKRATIMSIESQGKSLFVLIFAPLLGFFADNFSIGFSLFAGGIIILVFNLMTNKIKPDTLPDNTE